MTKEEYVRDLEYSFFTPDPTRTISLKCWHTGFTVDVNSEKTGFRNRKKALELYDAHLEEYLKNKNVDN